MRLACVISSLQSVDAERVLSMVANYWAAGGESVTLITLAGTDTDFDLLDSHARVIFLRHIAEANAVGEA